MLNKSTEDEYFTTIGDRVLLNRCPYCDIGMVIDTATDRYCPKCEYSDSTNVPFKVKLRFSITEVLKGNVTVIAEEPDGKISFELKFVDKAMADYYIDHVKSICLP